VKKFHPDRNGGDRDVEDRLQHVLQAYDYLKKSGFC
jgi:curved DNA-binding protein CbpA